MTQVIDITASYLKEHDYDGLVNGELECGCGLDDLAPCESNSMACEPAIEVVPPNDEYDRYFAQKGWTQTERIPFKQKDK